MNYYERHLGDYARDTAHLSLLEHGVYTLLLDRYYATEKGIPEDQAHRLARARTPEECAAVDAVLSEFFRLVDGFWINGRVEEEIVKALVRIDSARENGKRGGRPKKNPAETQPVIAGIPSGNPTHNPNVTQQKALHTPDTRYQAKEEARADARPTKSRGTRLPADWSPDQGLIAWAKAERVDIELTAEVAKFRDYWAAKAGAGGVKLDWSATFRNWIRNANPLGVTHANSTAGRKLSVVEQIEQNIHAGRSERADRGDAALARLGYGGTVDADG